MGENAAFLAAIAENLDEDLPRLIYADWLEERGERDRADFIRIQCEIAQLEHEPWHRTFEQEFLLRELQIQESTLWERNQAEWCEPWIERGWKEDSLRFHRGMPQWLFMDAREYLEKAEQIAEFTTITRATFERVVWYCKRLVQLPQLRQLRSLQIDADYLNDSEYEALAGSPDFSELRALNLNLRRLSRDALSSLAHSWSLPQLRRLSISREFDFGDTGFEPGFLELIQAGVFKTLESFRWRSPLSGIEAVRTLVYSPSLQNLRELQLQVGILNKQGLHALLDASTLPRLRTLDLSENRLEDLDAMLIARNFRHPQVRHLILRENKIADAGAFALAKSSGLSQLHTLDLRGNRIGTEAAQAMRNSEVLAGITNLLF